MNFKDDALIDEFNKLNIWDIKILLNEPEIDLHLPEIRHFAA